jgi:hypothetical protein
MRSRTRHRNAAVQFKAVWLQSSNLTGATAAWASINVLAAPARPSHANDIATAIRASVHPTPPAMAAHTPMKEAAKQTRHEGKKQKEAERRQAHWCKMTAALRGAARAQRSALACRRSTAALAAATERRRSAPVTRFLGPVYEAAGVTRSPLSQSSELLAGRS